MEERVQTEKTLIERVLNIEAEMLKLSKILKFYTEKMT